MQREPKKSGRSRPWTLPRRAEHQDSHGGRCAGQSAALPARRWTRQRGDACQALIEGFKADAVLANKGYDANHVLQHLAQREIQAVIPPKANRVEQREFDRHVYKDRNLVERFFCRLKQFRRIATRYEKLARNFFGMLSLACAYIWLA